MFFQVVQTEDTFATNVVTKTGKYYVTVVAFNAALEPSRPICSDGVTIDKTAPDVSRFTYLHTPNLS